jgi:succinoglycan biosynthesis transport protein ExoP
MELRHLYEILLRRKWVVIQAFAIIFLVVMGGTFLRPPTYETSAKVLYSPTDVQSSLLKSMHIEGLLAAPSAAATDLRTKISLFKVSPLLKQVIERLQVRDRNNNLMDPVKMINPGIMSRIFAEPTLDVVQETNSNTLIITASSSGAQEATWIANTLVDLYVEQNGEEKQAQSRKARGFVDSQLSDIKSAYFDSLENMSAFQRRNNTVDLDVERKVAIEKIASLMKEKEDNVIDIEQTLAKVKSLKAQLDRDGTTVSTTMLKDNPQVEALKRELAALKVKLADALTEKTENHPEVVAVKRQIAEQEKELAGEVARYRASVPELNTLEQQLASLRAHLVGVNKDIDHYAGLFKTLPETSKEAEKLKLALTASQSIYSSLLDYRNQMGIAESMALNDLKPVESAPLPVYPKFPNKPLNTIVGAFLGLVFGIGLAVVVEYADDTVRTAEDLEPLGLRLLGLVPKTRRRLIDRLDPNDPLSEAYRTVRNTLRFIGSNGERASLLVTSSGPREGKTTTVANLGISYSRAGVKTLVVDADLRRPGLHRLFRRPNDYGLTSIVSGDCTIEEALMATSFPNLSLLPAGPLKADPGWVIESERLRRLVEVLSRRFEVVIFDSAPPLIKSDVGILGHHVDATIQVVQRGRATKTALEHAQEVFRKCGVEPVGVVFNRFQAKRPPLFKLRGYKTLRQKLVLGLLALILGAIIGAAGYYALVGPFWPLKPQQAAGETVPAPNGKVMVSPPAAGQGR